MALDQSALLELLGELKLTDVTDRIRTATETLYQELIDAEAAAFIGAAPYERTGARVAQRNGTRPRPLLTTAGELDLRIPKLRAGTFFPSLLERRRRVDQALFAVVMEAYMHGVSTRNVDDLFKALWRRHRAPVFGDRPLRPSRTTYTRSQTPHASSKSDVKIRTAAPSGATFFSAS